MVAKLILNLWVYSTYMYNTSLTVTEANIIAFMEHYRSNFEEKVTPKMHLLEHHMVPYIKAWGLGTGLMGEQGAESIHASINMITRRFRNITNKEQQLLHVIKEHHLLVSPISQSKTPISRPKRRKMT